MGKASRDKGQRGERECCNLALLHGLGAERVAPLQAGLSGHPDVSLIHHPRYHIEVKRDEHKSVDAMMRQAEHDALEGRVPLLAYRRNAQPWRGVMPLGVIFDLINQSPVVARVPEDYDWIKP